MKIITDISECEEIIRNYNNSILDSYGYKKILNSYYKPDSFLFFVEGEDVIPLVVKNNLVTFYGGTQNNHINSLPSNKKFFNNVLSYLKNENYDFQLLSIDNDYFDTLDEINKHFDVPFPAEWHYNDIQNYDKINIINSVTGKQRWKFKRALKAKNNYTFSTMSFTELKSEFDSIMQAHINYFLHRGKKSIWENQEDLLFELLCYFDKEENLFIRLIKQKDDTVGIYIHIYDHSEVINLFISSLKKEDHYISKVMYFDALECAKHIANENDISKFNAIRGAFTNKKKFGLTPSPLYALVKDDNWIVKVDQDIDPQYYNDIYGRNSWGREK